MPSFDNALRLQFDETRAGGNFQDCVGKIISLEHKYFTISSVKLLIYECIILSFNFALRWYLSSVRKLVLGSRE